MANEPITQRISADLRRQIQEGSLGPGALIPSEPEVAREYHVSRQTARSALQALEQEGLVIVRPRRGRVVRSSQRLRWHLSEFERPDHTCSRPRTPGKPTSKARATTRHDRTYKSSRSRRRTTSPRGST